MVSFSLQESSYTPNSEFWASPQSGPPYIDMENNSNFSHQEAVLQNCQDFTLADTVPQQYILHNIWWTLTENAIRFQSIINSFLQIIVEKWLDNTNEVYFCFLDKIYNNN